jgi:hypothetical protein
MQTDYRISHTELSIVTFRCTQCRAEITIEFANDYQCTWALESARQLKCAICEKTVDRHTCEALAAFQQMRKSLAAGLAVFVFRIPGGEQTRRE